MGTYVYSLRKKHVEAKLDGIYPVDVIAFQYAYKESNPYPGDRYYGDYQRMVGRVNSLASNARLHYLERAVLEHGNTLCNFYFAMGGLEDGNIVYEVFQWLPGAHFDDKIPSPMIDSPAKNVGRLYKVGRGQWIVSEICPEHHYEYLSGQQYKIELQQCVRCDKIIEVSI